jgi:hypothetical protein
VTPTTRGRPPETGASSPWAFSAADSAFTRATQQDYFTWLDHVWPAAGCANPVRLTGDICRVDSSTGEVLHTTPTSDLPDGVIYKACGNRRTSVCPACANRYRLDAFHVIRCGLIGGKGVGCSSSEGTSDLVLCLISG